jgi:multicomponent Na+:H+ antiporter subunit G
MNEILSLPFIVLGGLFLLLSAVGLVRMPDLFTRMQAAAKASTLGSALTLVGLALYFGELAVTSKAVATIIFLMLTAPVAAHMIARAAYFIGVPLWHGTVRDDLRGLYDRTTHVLRPPRGESPAPNEEPGGKAEPP